MKPVVRRSLTVVSNDNDWRKVKEGNWKEEHTEFINSQFEKAEEVITRLSETKKGCEKIVKLYNIKNIKGYPKLLKKLK